MNPSFLDKLKAAYGTAKTYGTKLYGLSPFGFGLAAGYFGHGLIKAAASAAFGLVKLALKL